MNRNNHKKHDRNNNNNNQGAMSRGASSDRPVNRSRNLPLNCDEDKIQLSLRSNLSTVLLRWDTKFVDVKHTVLSYTDTFLDENCIPYNDACTSDIASDMH